MRAEGRGLIKIIILLLLLAVVRPTLEYGSEVWEANKTQAAALESVMVRGAKHILGCSSKTCNEAVRGISGLIRNKGVGMRISSGQARMG